jgi:hypothetical protein
MENPGKRTSLSKVLAAFIGIMFLAAAVAYAAHNATSNPFTGPKVNGGTVTFSKEGKGGVLTLSDDFKAPDAPDAHWRVVDSKGTVYLLDRLQIKGDKLNKMIKLPSYVRDVSKVQMWCAFAETVLGEAAFAKPMK